MSKPRIHRLGDLQLRIMKVLWDRTQATVAEVHEALGSIGSKDDLAYTTVATMLRKMEDRGLVRHESAGRTFIYLPIVGSDAVTRTMADDLLEKLFAGNLTDMVSHLLSTREVSREELSMLERLIEERKKKL